VEVDELIAAVRRNVAELRHSLAKEEAFLAELEARVGPVPAEVHLQPARINTDAALAVTTPELRRASRQEKAAVVRELIEGRPGRWTTVELREALTERGIDPHLGTPVKNILYSFVNDDHWGTAHGGGEYDFPDPFPEPTRNGSVPSQEGLSV
jgi:hypothetical protein